MINNHADISFKGISKIDFCGKPIYQLEIKDIFSPPSEINHTEGKHNYAECKQCQSSWKETKNYLTKLYQGKDNKPAFPNCCKYHAEAAKHKSFKKTDFDNTPEWTANKIIFTQQHIINNLENDNWYKDITDYVEYAVASFGLMPKRAYPLFLDNYYFSIKQFFSQQPKKVSNKEKIKYEAIMEFVDKLKNPVDSSKNTDLNVLIGYYQKWLNFFPFELHTYFGDLKTHFEKSIMVLAKAPEINKYSGTAKAQLHTKKSLQEALLKVTDELLTKVSGDKLFKNGVIKDVDKLEIDLIVQERQQELKDGYLNNAEKSDKRYRTAIKNWLNDEQNFWKKVNPYLKAQQVKDEPTKAQKLTEKLKPIGFFDLDKVKSLSSQGQINLVELIAEKQIPYAIAMLNYLGFIESLTKNHYSSKVKLNKEVAKMLLTADRNIKGNINVLSSVSKENRTRYTAHEHQEQVKKDYEKLK